MHLSLYPRSVTRSYYRGAAGAILVYDITRYAVIGYGDLRKLTAYCSRASFLNLSRWLADARALGSPQLVVVLVGNKADREEDREVEWAEASRWAAENGELPNIRRSKLSPKRSAKCQTYISSRHPLSQATT